MANPSIQLGTNSNWAIKEDKLLAYKEYNDYFFNKEFDFSRGTSATYVAKDGLIKTAGIQPNIVNNGDFSELGSELVTNGDFTDWTADNPDGWTVLNENANNYVTQDGTYARIVSNDTTSLQIRQTIFTIGKVYKVELDAVVNSGNVEGLKLNDATAAATIGYVNSTGHHTFYFRASGTAFVINRKGGGDTDISIDNVSVKQVDPNDYWTLGTNWSFGDNRATSNASTNSYLNQQAYEIGKTYKLGFEVLEGTIELRSAQYSKGTGFYTTGTYSIEVIPTTTSTHFYVYTGFGQSSITNITVQEIQTDTPRIDFTNDTKGHLLLEPSSTNKVTQSETFSTWSKINLTLTTTNILAPDGVTSVVKISSPNNLNVEHKIRFFTDTNSTTDSIFAKMGEVRYIYNRRNAGLWSTVIFDLQEGVVNNNYPGSSNVYAKMTYYGNGWYRCEVNYTGTLGSNETGWGLSDGTNQNYNPPNTTDGLYIWGAQQEDLDFATSYIPTTGATSTRNADVCNNSGSAQDFNSEEGVLYAEVASLAEDIGGSKNFAISDGTNNNTVKFTFRSAGSQIGAAVKSNGTITANNLYNMPVSNFFKVAFKYKTNDCALWVNGTEVATDTSAAMPLALNTLRFDRGDGGNDFLGKVRNVQVFTEALTDEQLQELTS